MTTSLEHALCEIPPALRTPLLKLYTDSLAEYALGRWEAVGLKAGKLAEVVYTIIQGKVAGSFASKPAKPSNMVDACRALERHNKVYGRSICIQIPRVLQAIYEMRNNRDIGHVGGEVDPNHMDAELLMRAVKWLIAELVRVFGNLPTDAARDLVESVTMLAPPVVWGQGNIKRVLNVAMEAKDKILLVLTHAAGGHATGGQLMDWSGYRNASRFRNSLLRQLHDEAFIHFDPNEDRVILSPSGLRRIQDNDLLKWQ